MKRINRPISFDFRGMRNRLTHHTQSTIYSKNWTLITGDAWYQFFTAYQVEIDKIMLPLIASFIERPESKGLLQLTRS